MFNRPITLLGARLLAFGVAGHVFLAVAVPDYLWPNGRRQSPTKLEYGTSITLTLVHRDLLQQWPTCTVTDPDSENTTLKLKNYEDIPEKYTARYKVAKYGLYMFTWDYADPRGYEPQQVITWGFASGNGEEPPVDPSIVAMVLGAGIMAIGLVLKR